MSKTDESPTNPSDDDLTAGEMKQSERWIAAALGLILSGLGTWAVFKSSNQAGSAILLLAGFAFLLIGIQATPLIKVGGSTANIELDRRHRWRKVIEQAEDEPNPQIAEGMIEAATIIDPELASSPHTQAILYEDRVWTTLRELFADVRRESPHGRYDFAVTTPMGQTKVEVKYRHLRNFRRLDVMKAVRPHKGTKDKIVVVTNAPLSGEVRMINGAGICEGVPVEVVTWNDPTHDDLLQRAIARGIS